VAEDLIQLACDRIQGQAVNKFLAKRLCDALEEGIKVSCRQGPRSVETSQIDVAGMKWRLLCEHCRRCQLPLR